LVNHGFAIFVFLHLTGCQQFLSSFFQRLILKESTLRPIEELEVLDNSKILKTFSDSLLNGGINSFRTKIFPSLQSLEMVEIDGVVFPEKNIIEV
jgi:hypothetical protein